MEILPEGWHRLMRAAKGIEPLDRAQLYDAVFYLQDLAEALQNIQATSSAQLTDPSLVGEDNKSYAKRILQRFRDWK